MTPQPAPQIVYLYTAYAIDQREGIHPDVPHYLDNHFGAHMITAQYEVDHVWIMPLYVAAQEIRVPVDAVWTVDMQTVKG